MYTIDQTIAVVLCGLFPLHMFHPTSGNETSLCDESEGIGDGNCERRKYEE
jgi:hypothetical protein